MVEGARGRKSPVICPEVALVVVFLRELLLSSTVHIQLINSFVATGLGGKNPASPDLGS